MNFVYESLKPYRLIISIYAIITAFFFLTEGGASLTATRTLFSESTFIKIATGQILFIGGGIGLLILFILYYTVDRKKLGRVKDMLMEFAIFMMLLVWSLFLIDILYISARPDNIILWSDTFMDMDKKIFDVYPAFFMYQHYNAVLEKIIVWTYNFLPIVAAGWTGFLIASQRIIELRLWSKRIFLALGICIPLWIVFPAGQPLSMYVVNVFDRPISAEIAESIAKGPPSSFLNQSTLLYADMRIDPTEAHHDVSNFPSMHAIWGLLLFASFARVFRSRYLSLLLFFIACANMLGAIYLLQHYAVDMIAGIVAYAGVIYILNKTDQSAHLENN